MKAKILFSIWLMLFGGAFAHAQYGFSMIPGMKQVDIPFEYHNNFIILTVQFNRFFPLKFIYDTGAENTILSKREVSDLLNVQYERAFTVRGSDLKTMLTAYLAREIRLEVLDKVVAPSEDILVLKEDYFRFEEYAGVNVHGILAGNIFANYLVKINYQKKVITLTDRSIFKLKDPTFTPVPIEIYRNKIYLNADLSLHPDSLLRIKLLLDTGAGLPLLLLTNTHQAIHPPATAIPSNIGMGLGGYLEGFTGRVQKIGIESLSQNQVVTYFQTLDTSVRLDYLNGRNGLMGNMLLSRFQVLIDYQMGKMWFKPSKDYKKAFEFDRSGLNIIASGLHLNTFTIQAVMQNSPAQEADLRKGDEILRVGATPTVLLSLSDILKTFQKSPGKKIKVVIRRDGKKIKKVLVLRDLL